MLTQEYAKSYINKIDKNTNKKAIVSKIMKIEKETNVELLDWNTDQLLMYLKSFDAISPISLNKNTTLLRDFVKYICENEKDTKERLYSLEDVDFLELINQDKLLSVTLTEAQFKSIRGQLETVEKSEYKVYKNGKIIGVTSETINYRNMLILELAWYGLTENEMKMLKISDIEFINRRGKEIAILSVIDDKFLTISNAKMIEDIKQTIVQKEVVKRARDGKFKRTRFRESEYLLKPNMCGAKGINDWLVKPAITLKGALIRGEIVCDEINMEYLSIVDIRRSRLIMILAEKNKYLFDFKSVASLYNLKNVDGLRWMRKVSDNLYGEK